jgi:hypothetical protein
MTEHIQPPQPKPAPKETKDKDKGKVDVPGVDVPDADGDKMPERSYEEPKGTLHADQYLTQFPGEKMIRKP